MILNRRVALNGSWLDEIDSRIVISGIEPGDGVDNISAVDSAAGYGQRITGFRRNIVDMVVKFRLMEHGRNVDGLMERSLLLETVNAWAAAAAPERGGAYMTMNYKPERRLHVVLAQAPGEGSLWDYTKEYQMTFRAYAVPFWEDVSPRSVRIGAGSMSGSGSFQVDGSVKTMVEAEMLNRSGMTVNSVNITVGGKTMTFSSLALAANETLVIDHATDGLIRIRIRATNGSYRSAMDKRSNTSADEFVVLPGMISANYAAQRACRLTLYWRCRYL